jgi:hypothetical protein
MIPQRDLGPWLSEADAMKHVAFVGTVEAFRKRVRRAGIPFGKFGHSRRYRAGELDQAIQNWRWGTRRRKTKAA